MPAMADPRRRLAAIMVGDLVGYTAQMAIDEDRALGTVRRMRVVVPPLVREHGGQWIKDVGDGFLASFDSAVAAVECAIAIQGALANEDVRLRIGIHLGDVIFTAADVFGDGVNIAARLEMLAPPGGICVSGQVHELIRNQAGVRSVRLGETSLGVEGYALAGQDMELPDRQEARAARAHASEKSDFVGRPGHWAWALWIGALALAALAGAVATYALLLRGTDLSPLGGDQQPVAAAPTAASVMSDARFITTASETAGAHFRRGVAAASRLDWPVAEASASLAVQDDGTFASAHLLLAVAREALGRSGASDGVQPLALARTIAELLPPGPERDLIIGAAHRAEGACFEADAALRSVEEAAPEWYAAHLDWELTSRADALRCAGRSEEARAHLVALSTGDDPAALAALVAHLLAVDGDIVAARRAARRAERSADALIRPDIVLFNAVELIANGDLGEARRSLGEVLDSGGGGSRDPGTSAGTSPGAAEGGGRAQDVGMRARMLLASLELRAGDTAAAARHLEMAAAEALAADLPRWRAEAHLQRAALAGIESGPAEERRRLAEFDTLHPTADGERIRLRLRLLDTLAGVPLPDRDLLDEAKLMDGSEARAFTALFDGAERLAADDANGAIEHLVAALEMNPVTVRAGAPSPWRRSVVQELLARAYSEAGDEATSLAIRRRLAGRDAQVAHAASIIETAIWLEARREVSEDG